MERAKPTPSEAQAARLKELEQRERALGRSLDKLERRTEDARKRPNPAPIGGMIGT